MDINMEVFEELFEMYDSKISLIVFYGASSETTRKAIQHHPGPPLWSLSLCVQVYVTTFLILLCLADSAHVLWRRVREKCM